MALEAMQLLRLWRESGLLPMPFPSSVCSSYRMQGNLGLTSTWAKQVQRVPGLAVSYLHLNNRAKEARWPPTHPAHVRRIQQTKYRAVSSDTQLYP